MRHHLAQQIRELAGMLELIVNTSEKQILERHPPSGAMEVASHRIHDIRQRKLCGERDQPRAKRIIRRVEESASVTGRSASDSRRMPGT